MPCYLVAYDVVELQPPERHELAAALVARGAIEVFTGAWLLSTHDADATALTDALPRALIGYPVLVARIVDADGFALSSEVEDFMAQLRRS
jgi:hypothetical protein